MAAIPQSLTSGGGTGGSNTWLSGACVDRGMDGDGLLVQMLDFVNSTTNYGNWRGKALGVAHVFQYPGVNTSQFDLTGYDMPNPEGGGSHAATDSLGHSLGVNCYDLGWKGRPPAAGTRPMWSLSLAPHGYTVIVRTTTNAGTNVSVPIMDQRGNTALPGGVVIPAGKTVQFGSASLLVTQNAVAGDAVITGNLTGTATSGTTSSSGSHSYSTDNLANAGTFVATSTVAVGSGVTIPVNPLVSPLSGGTLWEPTTWSRLPVLFAGGGWMKITSVTRNGSNQITALTGDLTGISGVTQVAAGENGVYGPLMPFLQQARKYVRMTDGNGNSHANAIIRLGWEMIGYWFDWGLANTSWGSSTADRAAKYKQAFRNVVLIMREVAGQNFQFDYNGTRITKYWAPTNTTVSATDMANSYPGTDAVDYISTDPYDVHNAGSVRSVTDGSIAVGSNQLTSASASWSSLDIGSVIAVGDSTHTAPASPYVSTPRTTWWWAKIVSYNGTVATLSRNAPADTAASDYAAGSGLTVTIPHIPPPTSQSSQTIMWNEILADSGGTLMQLARDAIDYGKPIGFAEWSPDWNVTGAGGQDNDDYVAKIYAYLQDPGASIGQSGAVQTGYDTMIFAYDGGVWKLANLATPASANSNGTFTDDPYTFPLAAAKYKQLFSV
jgi:hypothetical protein